MPGQSELTRLPTGLCLLTLLVPGLAAAPATGPDALVRAEAPRGEDEPHLTAGFGLALDRLQVDLGVDLSARRDTVSLSLIHSF